jgi:hypothetical protein
LNSGLLKSGEFNIPGFTTMENDQISHRLNDQISHWLEILFDAIASSIVDLSLMNWGCK